ncbi:MAG: TatD family hydrolase [Planctomycetota bacterium]
MRLIDTHAHLTYAGLVERVDEVLAKCAKHSVAHVITVGTDVLNAEKAIVLSREYPDSISAAVGIHPHHAAKAASSDLDRLIELWKDSRVVAFGEMGLDYHYDFAPREVQRSIFAAQLQHARMLDKPIIIHCREAFEDLVPILKEHGFCNRRVVFHCFTGTEKEAEVIHENGWRLSFTGIVTFRNSTALQAIARQYPLDRLMVETDSPYLSPMPVRGQTPNDPGNVFHVANFLAQLRGIPLDELAELTYCNSRTFFSLP